MYKNPDTVDRESKDYNKTELKRPCPINRPSDNDKK
jgi:hypothetical protein